MSVIELPAGMDTWVAEQAGLTLGDLISEREFADHLKVKPTTLAMWRRKGKGYTPPHVKWDGRVYYVRSVVNEWLNEQLKRYRR